MSRSLRALFGAAATAMVAGCAHALAMSSTSMTSIPAPDLHGRSFNAILVVAQVGDLGLRLAMEDRFATWATRRELVYAQQWAQRDHVRVVHCPPRTPEQVERGQHDPAFSDSLDDACARDAVAAGPDSGATAPPGLTRFVPSHTVLFPGRDFSSEQVVQVMRQYGIEATLVITPGEVGSTQSYVPPTYTTSCTGYNINYGCAQITTFSTGGFSYSKPWAQFSARLFGADDGVGVWIATATAGGNAFAHSMDLVQSMADKTMERLLADGVIR